MWVESVWCRELKKSNGSHRSIGWLVVEHQATASNTFGCRLKPTVWLKLSLTLGTLQRRFSKWLIQIATVNSYAATVVWISCDSMRSGWISKMEWKSKLPVLGINSHSYSQRELDAVYQSVVAPEEKFWRSAAGMAKLRPKQWRESELVGVDQGLQDPCGVSHASQEGM